MLTSKGVAGVPRATLVVLMASAASLRIPTAAILVLLGIDTLMDMGRSAMNVIGNGMAAAVVARWEKEMPATGNR
jgi:proton glutamate symport protein